MKLTPKNWAEMQHYKDRAPTWIKLHRSLLENYEFHMLPVASKALAPMLWLLSSEYEGGVIDATPEKIAFRLRMSVSDFIAALKPLIDEGFFFVEQLASSVLAECLPREEKETERETEKEIEKNIAQTSGLTPAILPQEKQAKRQQPDPENSRTWNAYAAAFFDRYGTEPVRNAKVNGQIAQLVKRLGEEAAHVAGFYLQHNGAWYVQKQHSVDSLLKDAEALRTQWATGRQVTGSNARATERMGHHMANALRGVNDDLEIPQ